MKQETSARRRGRHPFIGLSAAIAVSLAAMTETGAATLIPPDLAAPSGAVNLSQRGFLLNIHQLPDGVQRDPRHDLETVERQLAGQLIDPDTNAPYSNEVDNLLGPMGDGFYNIENGFWVVPEAINFNQETDPLFGGVGEAGNFTPDAKFPGIPGFGNSQNTSPPGTDDFALEAIAFLDLAAGTHRFGVNSDDGFRVTFGAGTNPKDAFAIQPEGAAFLGSRGPADSEWEVEIVEAGLYPVRLVYWEGSGGASVEFYSVTADGTKILVNAPNDPNAIKAYRTATSETPTVRLVAPAPDAADVFPSPILRVEIVNGDRTVTPSSVKLFLDGAETAADVSQSGGVTTASFASEELLASGSSHTAGFQFEDSAGAARSHEWQFTVAEYQTLSSADAHPLDARDDTAPGFLGRAAQARSGAGLEATLSRAEAQIRGVLVDPLTGELFENEASESTFVESGVINYEEEQRNNGAFTDANGFPDKPFPGIPGSGGHDNQFAVELVAYLELSAGLHVLGVTAQDGFLLSAGLEPRGVFGARSLASLEGTQPDPVQRQVVILAEQDGLYPIRLLQFESHDDPIINFTTPTDGAALEFYSIDPESFAADPAGATKILVNDRSNPGAILAWRGVSAEAQTYIASVSPPPNSSAQRTTAAIEVTLANFEGADPILTVNGEAVSANVSQAGGDTVVSYTPDVPLPRNSTVQVRIDYGGRSDSWNFATSSGEVAILITNVGEKQSDLEIKRRLEQVFGFDVLMLDDDAVNLVDGEAAFSIEDAQALEANVVYVASPVNSNKAGAQPWHTSGIPLINVEQADVDNFQYGAAGGIVNPPPTSVTILEPGHPMAAGFPEGEVVYADFTDASSITGIHQTGVGGLLPDPAVTVVAHVTGNTGQAALIAVEKGAFLLDGSVNPARIAHFGISGDDQFRSFTSDGFKLFDATVAWVMEIDPPASEPPVFAPVSLNAAGDVVISWTGDGELFEAAEVEGPYVKAANQANPQSRTPSETRRFFVLRQN